MARFRLNNGQSSAVCTTGGRGEDSSLILMSPQEQTEALTETSRIPFGYPSDTLRMPFGCPSEHAARTEQSQGSIHARNQGARTFLSAASPEHEQDQGLFPASVKHNTAHRTLCAPHRTASACRWFLAGRFDLDMEVAQLARRNQ